MPSVVASLLLLGETVELVRERGVMMIAGSLQAT